ncbi:hypothetical protein A9Q83_16745 [Alphaproteobacteria bacterium 46_93_T64]|nr:hypothetical protein A9Q83_16745 [Alphaproteobacteria bacterium 46_93_T64]
MKGMGTLIRVQKWKLDEKRRVISDMENLLASFRTQLDKLNHEQVREQEIAAKDPDAGFIYANYAEAAKLRRENLLNSIADSEKRIEVEREEMSEVFQELKKYEISEETRLRLLKELREKRDQEEMDGFSIEMHRRKSSS